MRVGGEVLKSKSKTCSNRLDSCCEASLTTAYTGMIRSAGRTRLLSKLEYMLTNLSYLRVIVLTKLLGLRIPYLHGVPLTH